MKCDNACCSKAYCLDKALFILRLAAGVIFVLHGYGKLFGNAPGMDMFTSMVAGLGLPMPGIFAYAAALSEFLGGLALLTGLYTKVFSALLVVVMAVAFAGVKQFKLPQGDVDIALMAIALAIHFAGPGSYTVRKWLMKGKGEACDECGKNGEHKH